MDLVTTEIEKQLQDQYRFGEELDQQVVVARIFNPYGSGAWYLINQNPDDTDYLWAIVDMDGIKMGEVSKSELENAQVPPFNLPLERDMDFNQINAYDLHKGLSQGKIYINGVCESPLGEKESAKLTQKMIVSENQKNKTEKMQKWVKTGIVDGVKVGTIRDACKRIGVSVSDMLPYTQK